ncbi:bone marrow proteoglycan-like isoform X1 [Catharus ustulatus]|uniref:bone marrow proteoglycan-like isoform X1 n=1 Tax=Catharus ustulatus TaxID=91951 RepID=UPI001408C759|nr:bone marrow proteoglycan-like isoform X1 [Catharus ustulatus]XP_032917739.1 bone marrow proteoglycan-like isoform X1 [Catharus ustulatus]
MQPYLLLALALLGTVPVSRSALASPAVEDEENVTELEVPEEYSGCLGAGDKQAPDVPSMPGTGTCRYVVIRHCQSFHHAQRICARRFRGRLASIHDYRTNAFLQHLACRHTNSGQVWIGAVSQPCFPHPRCHWTDGSPWNYSQWSPGHPRPGCRFCTALCTNSQWGLYGRAPGGLRGGGGRVLRGLGWGSDTGGLV